MAGHAFPRAAWAIAALLGCAMAGGTGAQDLELGLTPSVAGESGAVRQIGARIDAEDGLDGWDLPEPPAPPGGCPLAALVMPDGSGPLPNAWRHDYRSLDTLIEQESLIWELRICAQAGPMTVTLAIVEIGAYPADFQLWVHDLQGGSAQVMVPGTLDLEMTGLETTIQLEVLVGGGMSTESTSWSALRSLYR